VLLPIWIYNKQEPVFFTKPVPVFNAGRNFVETYIFVLLVGLAAGAISGVIGTGSSIMLLPVLVFAFGPKEAVPIMAIAAVMGNIARVLAWWREIDWKAFAAYSITGVPAAALGAQTLWILPVDIFPYYDSYQALAYSTEFSNQLMAIIHRGSHHRFVDRHGSVDWST
jgi:uncharacterized membrane protein YfcA